MGEGQEGEGGGGNGSGATPLDPAMYGSLAVPRDQADTKEDEGAVDAKHLKAKKPARSWLSRSAIATVVVGLCVMVAWWGGGHAGGVLRGGLRRAALVENSLDMAIEATNRYGSHVVKESLYPWLDGKKLVEPFMETTLTILDAEEDDTMSYDWDIYFMSSDEGEAELVGRYEGTSIVLMFPGVGLYTIQVQATDADKNVVGVYKEIVYCRYVRREMRELTEEDLQAFFDASFVLWNTTTEEGQYLYGENFYGIRTFMAYHLEKAGSRDCDHMHDGLGFFTQHAALTIKFEKAVQAVNPAVSLPYWDFTIESELINNEYDGDFSGQWFETEVFGDDMFGRVDPDTRAVSTGRWADVEMMMAYDGDVQNAYGFMRAPWNQNKDSHMTRLATFCGQEYDTEVLIFPNCELHYNAVAEYNTFSDFAWMLPYAPHGPVHVLTGGVYNCDASYALMDTLNISSDFRKVMAHSSFLTIKALWRSYLLECPSECSADTPQEDCLCYCPQLEEDIARGDLSAYFIDTVDSQFQAAVHELSFDDQITLASALCNAGILEGDQLEAASPFDPSFWPIHPTIERLWTYKKLLGFFSDEEWPDTDVSASGDDCYGHRSYDVIDMVVLDDDTYYTNQEFYDLMDPAKDTLSYVFDHFTWSHCLDYGVDFSQMTMGVGWGDSASSSTSSVGGGVNPGTKKKMMSMGRKRKRVAKKSKGTH